MLQLGALSVGRKGDPAAAPREQLEDRPDAAQRLHSVTRFGLKDSCLDAQDLLAPGVLKLRGDNLKGLVAVQARI